MTLRRDWLLPASLIVAIVGGTIWSLVSKAAERPNSATTASACKLLRSGQIIREWVIPAGAECHTQCAAALEPIRRADAETKVTGSTRYTCREDRSTTVSYVRAPVEPPPTCTLPPNRQQACPEPAYRPGSWTQTASRVTGTPPNCSVEWAAFNGLTSGCAPATQSSETPRPPGVLHFDNFAYDIAKTVIDAQVTFLARGWGGVKAENANTRRGSGWLYTQHDATRNSRVLVLESTPQRVEALTQTDYYLQYGREGSDIEAVPGNVWFQFWTYTAANSRFSTRDKIFYPCSSHYPCSWGPNLKWLFMWGSGGFNRAGDGSSNRYLALEAQRADRDTRNPDQTDARKLFQNVNATPLAGGTWYQVRMHMDTSGAQGTWEAWVRARNQSAWTKVADWRGGQTANFSWPLPQAEQGGHTMMRMPTTVNDYANVVLLDDWAMASSESGLP